MNRISTLLLCCCLFGCVQVDDGSATDVKPATPDATDQFASADQQLVAKILAETELQDADRLRHYAALYKGAANVLQNQTDVPMPQVLIGISKATANFMKPRSPAMQQIVKGLMPESGGAEADRPAISERFTALSLACHAAAHQLDTQRK